MPHSCYNSTPLRNRISLSAPLLRAVTAVVLLAMALGARAQIGGLPRATPEDVGLHSADVQRFFDQVTGFGAEAECHSAIVMRHGRVVGEVYPRPFRAEYSHTLYSCSKTFTAAAVGIAISQNRLSLDDRVAAILHSSLPETVSPELAKMTVRDLLMMASGITPDWKMRNSSHDWLRSWLAKPVNGVGTKFAYDSMCTFALSAIVQRVTGMRTLDYLKKYVFTPMNITRVDGEESPDGINTGGWGLHLQPESMAKFGQMLLNGGRWEDMQLVPEEWVKQMMTPHIKANATDYYGFQMWQCEFQSAWRADGAFGQYIFIIPDKDMVVVMTQCSHLNATRNRAPVWELARKAVDGALPTNIGAARQLAERCAAYAFETPKGQQTNAYQQSINGKTFNLPLTNDLEWKTIRPTFADGRLTLRISTRWGQSYDVPCGYGEWLTGTTSALPPYSIKAVDRFKGIARNFAVSGSYAWTPAGQLMVHVFYPSWITGAMLVIDPAKMTMQVTENLLTKPYTLTLTEPRRR